MYIFLMYFPKLIIKETITFSTTSDGFVSTSKIELDDTTEKDCDYSVCVIIYSFKFISLNNLKVLLYYINA